MLKNENKNILGTPEKKTRQKIFLSDSNTQMTSDKSYFRRQIRNDRKAMNTQPLVRKESPIFKQRRYHVRSGFNLSRRQAASGQVSQLGKSNTSQGSIFKRRVNSQTKVSTSKVSMNNEQTPPIQTQSKINFAKKIINDLKKATFQMKKNYPKFTPHSKSVQSSERTSINREKSMQSSVQASKPSNINQLKFSTFKSTQRKLANQPDIQLKKTFSQRSQNSKAQDRNLERDSKFFSSNDEVLKKMLKKTAQPLVAYSDFIKGGQNSKYEIKMEYFSHYLKAPKNQSLIIHIDFTSLRLLQSIYLCLIEMLSAQFQEKKGKHQKTWKYDILREYIEVYFQTYMKMKIQYILCEGLFKTAKKKLMQFFVMQRIIMYWIMEKCKTQDLIQHLTSLKKVVEFLKLSEEILKSIINMLYQDLGSKTKQDTLIDTFRSLRLTREIDKRLSSLTSNIQCIKQAQMGNDLLRSFFQMLNSIQKDANYDIILMFQLQQYYNWTNLMIPPLFYLPSPPSKPYTLVLDLDGTLIYYNEETKILKYRPYMDRFLIAMKKYFEIIIFSSHPKQRTDIIVREIQRDDHIFSYRLYKSHMVFQEGILKKNIDYLGRSLQKLIFIDDEQKNTQQRPSNSYQIKSFNGNKQDKQLLNLADWIINLMETEPFDVRGKLKKSESVLDEVMEVDEVSSTIQPSIQYGDNQKRKNPLRKQFP